MCPSDDPVKNAGVYLSAWICVSDTWKKTKSIQIIPSYDGLVGKSAKSENKKP